MSLESDNVEAHSIIILGDGETYASLTDCTLAILTPEGLEELDHDGIISEVEPWNILNHVPLKGVFSNIP